MNRLKHLLFAFVASSIVFTGCKNDDEETPTPETTTTATYNFSNVSYTDQTNLIAMMSELDAEMNKGRTAGTAVDAAKLKAMYENTGNHFLGTGLNAATVNLKSNTEPTAATEVEAFMDQVALASNSNTSTAAEGQPGLAVSGTSKYLLDANGVEPSQVISKMTMGVTFYYQIKNTLLSSTGLAADNNTVTTGEGTALQHNWDQAFGFYGVPTDFPTTKTGLKYLGNYSNQVDPKTKSNTTVMNAFIAGRQAINDKNATKISEQAIIVKDELEKVIAASAIHEFNAAKTSFTDSPKRNHYVSEAIGFLLALKYIDNANISPAEVDDVLAMINYPAVGGETLYDVSISDLNNAIDAISAQYDLDAVKYTVKTGF